MVWNHLAAFLRVAEGTAIILGGALLLGAAGTGVVGQFRHRRGDLSDANQRFLNGILVFIALCWIGFGVAVLA